MQRSFGSRVVVEYVDMAVPDEYQRHKGLLGQVSERFCFYPLVFVDGQLKLTGSAEYYEVLHVVRELMQPEPAEATKPRA